jgi:hypothetical protein
MAMTRSVAVTRGLLATGVVWGLGALVTALAFHAVGAHTTIRDVSDEATRAQIIWWGTQAFFACVGTLVGVIAGGTALTRGYVTEGWPAVGWTATPIVLLSGVGLVVLHSAGTLGTAVTIALAAGVVIGALASSFYVVESSGRDEPRNLYEAPRRRTGQSWGSR